MQIFPQTQELVILLDGAGCQACRYRAEPAGTCRLHGIDPYDYFVDVLQRMGQHPESRVDELTPRRWTQLFAVNPPRSDSYGLGG
jgi:hypothetical protein